MKSKNEIEQLILEDPDFISLKRFNYSIEEMKVRYPEGAPDHVCGAALLLSEEEYQEEYNKVVEKLKGLIGNVED